MAQDDGDELLRLLNFAVVAKADRPLDAEELAERVTATVGVRFVPETQALKRAASQPIRDAGERLDAPND